MRQYTCTGTSGSNAEAQVHNRRRRPVGPGGQPISEVVDAFGWFELGVDDDRTDDVGMPPYDRSSQLDAVTGNAPSSVAGALRGDEVEYDTPASCWLGPGTGPSLP